MTLFAALADPGSVFATVLEAFDTGHACVRTQDFLATGTRRT